MQTHNIQWTILANTCTYVQLKIWTGSPRHHQYERLDLQRIDDDRRRFYQQLQQLPAEAADADDLSIFRWSRVLQEIIDVGVLTRSNFSNRVSRSSSIRNHGNGFGSEDEDGDAAEERRWWSIIVCLPFLLLLLGCRWRLPSYDSAACSAHHRSAPTRQGYTLCLSSRAMGGYKLAVG